MQCISVEVFVIFLVCKTLIGRLAAVSVTFKIVRNSAQLQEQQTSNQVKGKGCIALE